jgi:hypothetical protein
VSTANNIPNNVLIQQDTPNQVIINQDSQNLVTIRTGTITTGPTRRHVHTQTSPSSTWTIIHALGGKPSVTVVDTGDNVVHGDVQYISATQIQCSFSDPFAGKAYLT